jgi:hypothetical protein
MCSFLAFPPKGQRLLRIALGFRSLMCGDVTHPSSLLIAMALFGLMVVEIATRLHASA